jgi:hypothetical protein
MLAQPIPVNGEQSSQGIGEIEPVRPVISQFADKNAEQLIHQTTLARGGILAAEGRERGGEKVLDVLGDR